MQQLHVPAGATIFSTGDPSRAVYVIEGGEVAITVNGGIEVARLHAGELFGESGVLEARSRAATATAIIATTLLITEADIFFRAGTINGTTVNGTTITRASLNAFVPLHRGDNEVIAGGPGSPFRFRVQFAEA
jgi:CRP-like cAMP-binding protein